MKSKPAKFVELLQSPELEFIMEAHNGLSAIIAEEAGFKGIWASGLSISAALGVRDNNEASWTQILEVLEFMSDATSVPIMLDGDTGYGNFNNMRRLVQKLEQRNIAAVCIEDKLFPKTNSFIGENQPLADIVEFCGKIRAGKDSQRNDDFSIVARVEALIAGWGIEEALKRAEAYHHAGADAILIHSKKSQPEEILQFKREWGKRCPVIIVPTMYYSTPTEIFREAGISVIIWANHNMRSAITAMRETSRKIYEEQSLLSVEHTLPSVKEVFELQNNQELAEAEKLYLPSKNSRSSAIILAASRGSALGTLTENMPKAMLDVRGRPLLEHSVEALKNKGIEKVTVVRGYAKEAINLPGVQVVDNDDYAETGEAYSLNCALEALEGEIVLFYGDTLFRPYILDLMQETEGDIVLVVDAFFREIHPDDSERPIDVVTCSDQFRGNFLMDDQSITLKTINKESVENCDGEWIGLARLSERGAARVREILEDMAKDGDLNSVRLTDIWQRLLIAGDRINIAYIAGHWLDVDDVYDLAEARDFM